MKTPDDYRKDFVFGKCPGEAHGNIIAGPSLHCGKCLTATFESAIASARAQLASDLIRRSRLKDALMFALADLDHSEECDAFVGEEHDCGGGLPCTCWRAEAEAAIDENRDADLCTKLRDLRDRVEGDPFGGDLAELRAQLATEQQSHREAVQAFARELTELHAKYEAQLASENKRRESLLHALKERTLERDTAIDTVASERERADRAEADITRAFEKLSEFDETHGEQGVDELADDIVFYVAALRSAHAALQELHNAIAAEFDALKAECAGAESARRIRESNVTTTLKQLLEVAVNLEATASESTGIAGYHNNGELLEWGVFGIDVVREVIASARAVLGSDGKPGGGR